MFKLSNSTINKKGILIFKHLEQGIINNLARTNSLDLLRKKYIIGLYFGGATSFDIKNDLIDFVVAKKNVISNENEITKPILRYSGNSFISSDILQYRESIKKLDYVGIFLRSKRKRPEDFIEISKILQKHNPELKIHLLTYGHENNNLTFLDHGYSHPNFVHEDFITTNSNPFPISQDKLYKLISSSKAFIHPSNSEGASRMVIASCLLSVPVLYNEDIKGGTFSDELIKANAVYSYKAFSDIVNFSSNILKPINLTYLDNNFVESITLKRFFSEIEGLNLNTNKEYNFIENTPFSKLLPSHGNIIPARFTNQMDDQFIFSNRLLKYLQEEDKNNYSPQKIKLVVFCFIEFLKIFKLRIKKKIWEILN